MDELTQKLRYRQGPFPRAFALFAPRSGRSRTYQNARSIHRRMQNAGTVDSTRQMLVGYRLLRHCSSARFSIQPKIRISTFHVSIVIQSGPYVLVLNPFLPIFLECWEQHWDRSISSMSQNVYSSNLA